MWKIKWKNTFNFTNFNIVVRILKLQSKEIGKYEEVNKKIPIVFEYINDFKFQTIKLFDHQKGFETFFPFHLRSWVKFGPCNRSKIEAV